MNGSNDVAKDVVGVSAAGRPAEKNLDPCAKPQAQEAIRLRTADEACDDGVD